MYKVMVGRDNICIYDGPGAQRAILSFVFACIGERTGDAAIGFKWNAGVLYGYKKERGEELELRALLYGVTIDEWEEFGPPDSMELRKEEVEERGLKFPTTQ